MGTMQITRKKKLFTADYEIHASIKMLYPYLHSASGLSEWFADDAKINNQSKVFSFIWDHEEHNARLVAHRRSEEQTSELQSLMRNSYAVFCLTKKKIHK